MITVLRCYFCPTIFRKYSMSFAKYSMSIFQKSLSISQKSALGENAIIFWEFQNILTILTHETRNAHLQRLCEGVALARYSPRQSPRYSPTGWVWSALQKFSRSGDRQIQSRRWPNWWVSGWVSGWVSFDANPIVYRPFSLLGWVWWGVLGIYLLGVVHSLTK